MARAVTTALSMVQRRNTKSSSDRKANVDRHSTAFNASEGRGPQGDRLESEGSRKKNDNLCGI